MPSQTLDRAAVTPSRVENTADFLLAEGRDRDLVLIDQSGRYTYAQLRSAVGGLLQRLSALELEPGSRVAVLGPNSFFWLAGYLATIKADLVAVPVASALTPVDAAHNLRNSQCRVLFADRRSLKRLNAVLPPGVIVITEEAIDLEAAPPPPSPTADPDADATLMFTSGSTAAPKAVRVTHRNIQANTDSIVSYLGLVRDDRMLVILPFSYVFGASLLHTHLRVGASLAVCNTFTLPETAVEMMAREGATGFAGVPSTFSMLTRLSTFCSRDLPSLRHIQQAGGRLDHATIAKIVAGRKEAAFYVMYGQTEATARLSYLPPDEVLTRPGSIGRGIPGVTLRVLDSDGNPVAPGAVGELYAQGDNISPGYLDDPDASHSKFTPHGLRTGDLGTVDDDGYVYILDRKDDFIKIWGFRVSSRQIEECALEMAGIVDAAAVGVPDRDAGELVALFVVTEPGAVVTSAELAGHLRGRLAKHMQPYLIRMVSNLPLNSSGKVAKSRLREMAAETTTAERRYS